MLIFFILIKNYGIYLESLFFSVIFVFGLLVIKLIVYNDGLIDNMVEIFVRYLGDVWVWVLGGDGLSVGVFGGYQKMCLLIDMFYMIMLVFDDLFYFEKFVLLFQEMLCMNVKMVFGKYQILENG